MILVKLSVWTVS